MRRTEAEREVMKGGEGGLEGGEEGNKWEAASCQEKWEILRDEREKDVQSTGRKCGPHERFFNVRSKERRTEKMVWNS